MGTAVETQKNKGDDAAGLLLFFHIFHVFLFFSFLFGCCSLLLVGRTGRSSHPSSIKMSTLYTRTRDKGFLASTRECSARPHTDQRSCMGCQGVNSMVYHVRSSAELFIITWLLPLYSQNKLYVRCNGKK